MIDISHQKNGYQPTKEDYLKRNLPTGGSNAQYSRGRIYPKKESELNTMFSQTEDFERCPNCQKAYFKEDVEYVISKEDNRDLTTEVNIVEKITFIRCVKCNYTLSKFTDNAPYLFKI